MTRRFLPYSRQYIDEADIKAVEAVLRSDYVTQGPLLNQFEEALARSCQVQTACVVATGSAALQAACFALDVKRGDEVLVPNNTFVATANCVVHCGGTPVLVDSAPGSFHMSVDDLEKKISDRTVGIIPMHYGGMPADMRRISEIARSRGLWIIEDASHAIGATYDGEPMGSCRYSDITIFSFHPVKPLCAGEGGAIVTNRDDVYHKVRQFANNGITKDPGSLIYPDKAAPEYAEMQILGFNFRITEMQCALGLSQLKKLPSFINRRNAIAKKYYELLSDYKEIEMPLLAVAGRRHCAYHLFPVLIDFAGLKKSRATLMLKLRDKKIGTQVHYIPLSRQPYYQQTFGYREGQFPNSESVYERALSLPVSAMMDEDDVRYVCTVLHELLKG